MAPGSEATINYGSDSVAVTVKLTLTSADQKISADGTFGRPGDALNVKLANVDLANVDALLLRPPQLTGPRRAAGTISGTKDAPAVKAGFEISQGGFRQYRYETFGGTVNYNGSGVTLDTKLQQNPTTFITAKGYVPVALFKGGAMDDRDAAHGAPAAKDQIDLHIEHADRPRSHPGVHDRADQRHRDAPGEGRHHGLGGRPAPERRRERRQGGVHGCADRRQLREPAGRSIASDRCTSPTSRCSITTRARCRSPATWPFTNRQLAAFSCTSANDFKVIDS